MKQWISLSRVEGQASRQAHADFPENTFERELGREGFFGPATHMHHKHAPTGWIDWHGPLKPRALDLNKINHSSDNPWNATTFLHNQHVKIRFWQTSSSMTHLVRNGDGDELIFVHEGSGELYCDYGHMTIRDGDYVMLPRGTMWRLDVNEPISALLMEATSDSYKMPDKGMLGGHAIFDPAVLDAPRIDEAFLSQQSDHQQWQVMVKRREQITTITYPFNPLDAVGWHGNLMPVRINWRDIRPIMSHRYHLPPSAHTTFLSNRFVVCTFCPRPLESDPGALKVPFYHNNEDFDEVLFYHRGNFFSRDNIHPGMVTFHPSGFTHGPHPKAYHAAMSGNKNETDEVAVMIDTRDALEVGPLAQGVELEDYVHSWQTAA
jgi:homogentisate 1,2-dioxygenase